MDKKKKLLALLSSANHPVTGKELSSRSKTDCVKDAGAIPASISFCEIYLIMAFASSS